MLNKNQNIFGISRMTPLTSWPVEVMVEQSSFCDIVCKSPETQQMAKIFAEDYGFSPAPYFLEKKPAGILTFRPPNGDVCGILQGKSSLNWWIFMGTSSFFMVDVVQNGQLFSRLLLGGWVIHLSGRFSTYYMNFWSCL